MINIYIVIAILFIHFIADFVLQSHDEEINKSHSNYYLTMHVLTYSAVWLCVGNIYSIITKNNNMEFFCVITFISHWITDYFTSRNNAKLWAKGNMHNFFVGVGFDQFLHFVQLLLTFYILQ